MGFSILITNREEDIHPVAQALNAGIIVRADVLAKQDFRDVEPEDSWPAWKRTMKERMAELQRYADDRSNHYLVVENPGRSILPEIRGLMCRARYNPAEVPGVYINSRKRDNGAPTVIDLTVMEDLGEV